MFVNCYCCFLFVCFLTCTMASREFSIFLSCICSVKCCPQIDATSNSKILFVTRSFLQSISFFFGVIVIIQAESTHKPSCQAVKRRELQQADCPVLLHFESASSWAVYSLCPPSHDSFVTQLKGWWIFYTVTEGSRMSICKNTNYRTCILNSITHTRVTNGYLVHWQLVIPIALEIKKENSRNANEISLQWPWTAKNFLIYLYDK